MDAGTQDKLPPTLLTVLSNTLVWDATLPYLPLSAILRIAAVSKAFNRLIFKTPRVFRYLDLSRCRGAYVAPPVKRTEPVGQNWRANRIEKNLAEKERYGGALRGICKYLSRKGVMKDVHSLVLNGVGSVTLDVLSDILLSDQYNVRLLSVVGCQNLNGRMFQQLLHFLCRPSRPEGTPRLKGVYVFGTSETAVAPKKQGHVLTSRKAGVTALPGAQPGAASSSVSSPTSSTGTNSNPWFSRSGLVIPPTLADSGTWEETLRVCSGIIAFDAVLCTHMHREMAPYRADAMRSYLTSATPIATYALGPDGCAGCGRVPEGAPIWGQADLTAFPLVSPPHFSGALSDAVRPIPISASEQQTLVVSCVWCLSDRYCQSCHRYWCGRCYDPNRGRKIVAGVLTHDDDGGRNIKVYNRLCTQFCAFGEDLAAGNGAMWG